MGSDPPKGQPVVGERRPDACSRQVRQRSGSRAGLISCEEPCGHEAVGRQRQEGRARELLSLRALCPLQPLCSPGGFQTDMRGRQGDE